MERGARRLPLELRVPRQLGRVDAPRQRPRPPRRRHAARACVAKCSATQGEYDTEKYDRDGVVWCVDYVRAHERLPAPLREALEQEGANVFTTELLAEQAPELDDLGGEHVLFVEPRSFDARIVNQYALFAVVSPAELRLEEWLAPHEDLARRVVVPAELKWKVRDKLDQANVTERVLFPVSAASRAGSSATADRGSSASA